MSNRDGEAAGGPGGAPRKRGVGRRLLRFFSRSEASLKDMEERSKERGATATAGIDDRLGGKRKSGRREKKDRERGASADRVSETAKAHTAQWTEHDTLPLPENKDSPKSSGKGRSYSESDLRGSSLLRRIGSLPWRRKRTSQPETPPCSPNRGLDRLSGAGSDSRNTLSPQPALYGSQGQSPGLHNTQRSKPRPPTCLEVATSFDCLLEEGRDGASSGSMSESNSSLRTESPQYRSDEARGTPESLPEWAQTILKAYTPLKAVTPDLLEHCRRQEGSQIAEGNSSKLFSCPKYTHSDQEKEARVIQTHWDLTHKDAEEAAGRDVKVIGSGLVQEGDTAAGEGAGMVQNVASGLREGGKDVHEGTLAMHNVTEGVEVDTGAQMVDEEARTQNKEAGEVNTGPGVVLDPSPVSRKARRTRYKILITLAKEEGIAGVMEEAPAAGPSSQAGTGYQGTRAPASLPGSACELREAQPAGPVPHLSASKESQIFWQHGADLTARTTRARPVTGSPVTQRQNWEPSPGRSSEQRAATRDGRPGADERPPSCTTHGGDHRSFLEDSEEHSTPVGTVAAESEESPLGLEHPQDSMDAAREGPRNHQAVSKGLNQKAITPEPTVSGARHRLYKVSLVLSKRITRTVSGGEIPEAIYSPGEKIVGKMPARDHNNVSPQSPRRYEKNETSRGLRRAASLEVLPGSSSLGERRSPAAADLPSLPMVHSAVYAQVYSPTKRTWRHVEFGQVTGSDPEGQKEQRKHLQQRDLARMKQEQQKYYHQEALARLKREQQKHYHQEALARLKREQQKQSHQEALIRLKREQQKHYHQEALVRLKREQQKHYHQEALARLK
ncbi:hypothetical protein NDU88_001506 [Pleurodeles waltl]|uniref:Uncharacterized protein n=1 Tax=Pleurodeles waltl TaxID=8319 RepID=A0AAV7TI06_PLEWA|nr:hypothetical protein NDU88_001506 [Pleurodeles waltl]